MQVFRRSGYEIMESFTNKLIFLAPRIKSSEVLFNIHLVHMTGRHIKFTHSHLNK